MKKILSASENELAMEKILELMNKGEVNLSENETNELRILALSAQSYEQNIYTIPQAQTLEGMIELRMYEMKLKQKDLAKKLNVSDAKLSLILAGKQKPDVAFIKEVHRQLDVSADFVLEVI